MYKNATVFYERSESALNPEYVNNAGYVHYQAVGTLPWIAPEPFNGEKKADIYSYGMIMWELAARENPYANLH